MSINQADEKSEECKINYDIKSLGLSLVPSKSLQDFLKDFTCFDSDIGSMSHKVISQMLLLSLEPHTFHAK